MQKDYCLLVLRVRGRETPGRGSWSDRTMLEALLQVEQGSLRVWKDGSLPFHNKHILKSFDTLNLGKYERQKIATDYNSY